MISQALIHYSLHLLFPGIIAILFFRAYWKIAWGVLLLTMLVDLDHLIADPIFDPQRCSIGFHPFHTEYAVIIYAGLLFIKNKWIRLVSLGLLFHMATDLIDCVWMCGFECF